MKIKDLDTVNYFAYGHNTNSKVMLARCPHAELIGNGILKNFCFVLRKFADIESQPGAKCYGVLWRINRRDLQALDHDEDYHRHYNRILVDVETDSGPIKAQVYIMDPAYHPEERASKDYVRSIAQGYQEHNLPVEQIKQAL
jgi:cation transport regulator ChaC